MSGKFRSRAPWVRECASTRQASRRVDRCDLSAGCPASEWEIVIGLRRQCIREAGGFSLFLRSQSGRGSGLMRKYRCERRRVILSLNLEQKQAVVDEVRARVAEAQAIVLAEYRSLGVGE